jgi:hypothetical protein
MSFHGARPVVCDLQWVIGSAVFNANLMLPWLTATRRRFGFY